MTTWTKRFAKALLVCVLYVVLIWLLNADWLGIQLWRHISEPWFTLLYRGVFVAFYAGLLLIVLLVVLFIKQKASNQR